MKPKSIRKKDQPTKFLVRIGKGGTITLPKPFCEALKIKLGDYLSISLVRRRIVLRPVRSTRKKGGYSRNKTRARKEKTSTS